MKKLIDTIRDNKWLGILLLLGYGIVISFVLVVPFCNDLGSGWVDFRMERLTPRYSNLLQNGTVFTGERDALSAYGYYLPYVMKWTGITDTAQIQMLWQSFFGGIVIAVYPLMIHMLWGNYLVSLLSPFIAHLCFGDYLYVNKCGEYFGEIWAVAIGLPLILMLGKSKKKKDAIIITSLIAAVLSVTNTIRYMTGFPLLVVAIILLLWKFFRKVVGLKEILIGVVLLIVCFNLLNVVIPKTLSEAKGVKEANYYTACPFHTMLIGLGYIDNPYGLSYSDTVAFEMVEERFQGEEYEYPYGEKYGEACKELYMEILRKDPGFVIKAYLVKLKDCIWQQALYVKRHWLPAILCILIIVITLVMRCMEKKRVLSILIWGYALTLLSCIWGLIGIPVSQYMVGGVGGIGVLICALMINGLNDIYNEFKKRKKKDLSVAND